MVSQDTFHFEFCDRSEYIEVNVLVEAILQKKTTFLVHEHQQEGKV